MSYEEEQRRDADLERQRTADQRLKDTRLNEDAGESVLDRGRQTPSYAFREPPPPEPIAGGGLVETPQMALERERAAEAHMRRTSEQFLGPGSGTEDTRSEREPVPDTGASLTDQERQTEDTETQEEEEPSLTDEVHARQLWEQQRDRERQIATQRVEQRQGEMNQRNYDLTKLGSATTIFGPPFIIAYQTIRELFFPSNRIPNARFSEKIGCFLFFFSMCFGWLIAPPFFIGPLFLLIAGAVLILSKIGGL